MRSSSKRKSGRGRATSRSRFALGLALALGVSLGCTPVDDGVRAVDGRVDLSRHDFSRGSAELSGRWSVCWGQLLEPGAACPTGWETVGVRGLWSDASARSPFGGRGVATYRLAVGLPGGDERLSLRAGAPMTAYRLFVDEEDRGGVGVVGHDAATTSSEPRRNRVFELPRGSSEVVLLVQLANFEFRGGGIRRPWIVGSSDAIQRLVGQGILRDALLFAVSLVVGLAYLVQFAMRPKESARGYFGMFALVIAARSVPGSISDFAQLVVPWASFAGLLRFEYLGDALGLFAGAGYFRVKVPGVTPPRTMRLFQLIALALAPIVLLAPLPIMLETLPFFLVLPPLVMLVVLVCYALAWLRGTAGVGTTLVAGLVFMGGVVHDVLRAGLTDFGFSIELFPYLLVVWILAEAVELAQIFSRTFGRVETLSHDLVEANFELQETESSVSRFVPFDVLRLFGKSSVREIATGDHVRSSMSVMHCDVRDLARVTEGMSDEDSFGLVDELVRRVESPIHRHGGFVNQFRGDGLQALFPTGADDATKAARAVVEAVRTLNRRWRASGGRSVVVGVGIDTGPLLLGTLGDEDHVVVGVVGDATSTAARIAALTRSTDASILISDSTRGGLTEPSCLTGLQLTLSGEAGEDATTVFEVRCDPAAEPPG